MGMGFKSISVSGANPLFQTFIAEGKVASPMFGFKLATTGSELFLGGVNPDYKEDDFAWVPLSNEVCQIFKCVNCVPVSNVCSSWIGLLASVL